MTPRLNSFLAGLVLTGSIAILAVPEPRADTDHELTAIWPDGTVLGPICAKSLEVCKTAATSTWIPVGFSHSLREADVSCRPRPGCFPEESNCIQGFNCRERK